MEATAHGENAHNNTAFHNSPKLEPHSPPPPNRPAVLHPQTDPHIAEVSELCKVPDSKYLGLLPSGLCSYSALLCRAKIVVDDSSTGEPLSTAVFLVNSICQFLQVETSELTGMKNVLGGWRRCGRVWSLLRTQVSSRDAFL